MGENNRDVLSQRSLARSMQAASNFNDINQQSLAFARAHPYTF